MSASRGQTSWLRPSEKLALSAKLRDLWTAHPELTTNEITAMTDAPRNVVVDVRKRLVKAGILGRPG